MNFTQIENSVIRDPGLTLSAFRVLVLLCSYNPCFPSYRRIMALTGIRSEATVRKSLKELEDGGYIKVLKRGYGGFGFEAKSSSYLVLKGRFKKKE